MKSLAIVLRIVGVVILLWPVLPPLLRSMGATALADDLEWPWTLTCHRLPERTLSIFGSRMPMCSRCLGLDTGFGVGLSIGAPYRGPKLLWAWLAVAGLLLVLEMVTQNMGVHPIWHFTRILTGALVAFPVGAALTAIAARES